MYLTLFLIELFFTVCNSGRPWVSWLKWQRYRVASEKWFRHCKVLWWTVRNVYIVEASIGKWWCFFSPNQAIIVSATVLSMCFYFLSFFPDPSFFTLFMCVCVFLSSFIFESGQGTSEGKRALYHCNYCNKDITGKIRIKCFNCPDFDLCIECFSVGAEVQPHKSNHPYRVMVSNTVNKLFLLWIPCRLVEFFIVLIYL